MAATVLVGLLGLGATGVPERTTALRGQHEALERVFDRADRFSPRLGAPPHS